MDEYIQHREATFQFPKRNNKKTSKSVPSSSIDDISTTGEGGNHNGRLMIPAYGEENFAEVFNSSDDDEPLLLLPNLEEAVNLEHLLAGPVHHSLPRLQAAPAVPPAPITSPVIVPVIPNNNAEGTAQHSPLPLPFPAAQKFTFESVGSPIKRKQELTNIFDSLTPIPAKRRKFSASPDIQLSAGWIESLFKEKQQEEIPKLQILGWKWRKIAGTDQLQVTLSDGKNVTKQTFVHVNLVDLIKATPTYSVVEVHEGALLHKQCYFLITKMSVICSAKSHLLTAPYENLELLDKVQNLSKPFNIH